MPFPCADSLCDCPRVGKISNLWLISQPSVGISGPALFYLYHGHVSFWLALMRALPKYLHADWSYEIMRGPNTTSIHSSWASH